MEKKKIMAACVAGILCLGLAAQKDTVFKKGLIRGQANISGGYLFHTKKYAAYISGNMDYYLNEHFSLAGEAWASFDIVTNEQTGLRKNFSVLAGLHYHPVKYSRWDPYIGFAAGAGIITTNYYADTLIRESPVLFSPLVSVDAGLNYYVGSIFHFFVQCRFVAGGNNTSNYGRAYLEELKFSGGLGWNFMTGKKRKKYKQGH